MNKPDDTSHTIVSSIGRLGKQSFLYVAGGVLTQILAVLLIPIYSRVLTTEEYGLLGIASTVQKILIPILGLGIAGAITRMYFDTHDEQERRKIVGSIWLGWLGIVLIMAAFVYLLGASFSDALFKSVSFSPYIQLAIGVAALNALTTVPMALLRAREQAGWFSIFSVLTFLSNALFIIYFVVIRRQGAAGSLRGQLYGLALINLLYAGMMFFYIHREIRFSYLKASLAFGIPMVPHFLATWALNFSDRWILDRYTTLAQIGIYTLAYQFGQSLGMILNSANRAWSPFFYRKIQEPNGSRLITRIITYYVAALVWLAVGVSLLARPVVTLMATPQYHSAYKLIPIIATAYMLQGFYFLVTNILLFVKDTKKLPLITGTSAIINILLNLILIPRWGITAAAINTFLGYLLLFLITYFFAQRALPLHYDYRRIVWLIALAFVVYILGILISFSNPWLELIVRGLWALSYPLLLLLMGFVLPEERRLLNQMWHQVTARLLHV